MVVTPNVNGYISLLGSNVSNIMIYLIACIFLFDK